MNRFVQLSCAIVIAAALQTRSIAYEVGTHAKITEQAFKQSLLGTLGPLPTKFSQLGLHHLNGIVGTQFKEFAGAQTTDRKQYQYEWNVQFAALFSRGAIPGYESFPYSPAGWMVAGAIREDDASVELLFPEPYIGDDKSIASEVLFDDRPIGGHVNRFCNHFYDPTKGGSGTLDQAKYSDVLPCVKTGFAGASWGIAAPAWALALQTGTSFFQAMADLQSRANHLALADAKEAMWRASTGYDGQMQTKVAATGSERMKYWAATFRNLGGAVHLLQDMAQAQHTRNEGHALGIRPTYEKYVEWRTANTAETVVFNRRGDFRIIERTLTKPWNVDLWTNHPIPRFTKYEHYWHKSDGNGLAVYSNRGFLTPGKNIGNSDYPLPPPISTDSRYNPVTQQETIDGRQVNITRLYYAVPDSATAANESIPMTRKTTVSWITQSSNAPSSHSVSFYGPDEAVYDAQAGLQLPRAVAYSAGLIDHFFRGQLRIDAPASGVFAYVDTSRDDANDPRFSTTAFRRLKFRVTNTTEAITPPGGSAVAQNIANAKLVAAVKYFDNTCWSPALDLSGEWGAPQKRLSQLSSRHRQWFRANDRAARR